VRCNACDRCRPSKHRRPHAWRKPAMRTLCLTLVIVVGGFWIAGAYALDTLAA
jgi:hypothetical protein